MGKNRKTLKQKKLADRRRKFYTFEADPVSSFKSDVIIMPMAPPNSAVYTTNKYPYLIQDIIKTMILTATIVAFEVILFFLLKNKWLILPMIKY